MCIWSLCQVLSRCTILTYWPFCLGRWGGQLPDSPTSGKQKKINIDFYPIYPHNLIMKYFTLSWFCFIKFQQNKEFWWKWSEFQFFFICQDKILPVLAVYTCTLKYPKPYLSESESVPFIAHNTDLKLMLVIQFRPRCDLLHELIATDSRVLWIKRR